MYLSAIKKPIITEEEIPFVSAEPETPDEDQTTDTAIDENIDNGGGNNAIWIIIAIVAVVLIGGAVVAVIIIKKKKVKQTIE